jgi:predicted dehydrogenase
MEPKYGIIGCGNISRFHFAGLAKIGARVVHIADIDEAKARSYAEQFKARYTGDYHRVIADPEVTVVSILGPGKYHRDMCLEAIAAGKDILCEKTLADNPQEAVEIVQAVRSKKTLFFTTYMKRFFPAVQKAKELLPGLGTLFSAQVRGFQNWGDLYNATSAEPYQWIINNYGGAILKCGGSHMLDLTMYLLGRPVSVYGNIDYVANSKIDRRASAMLEYPSSLVVNFEAATHPLAKIGYEKNSWDEKVEINGTNGRLEIYTVMWDHPENNAALLVHYDNTTKTSTEYRFDAIHPFHEEIAYYHRCLTERKQGKPDVIDGFNVDTVIAAIVDSHQKKSSVKIDWKGI